MVKELEGSQNVFAGPLLATTQKLSQVSIYLPIQLSLRAVLH